MANSIPCSKASPSVDCKPCFANIEKIVRSFPGVRAVSVCPSTSEAVLELSIEGMSAFEARVAAERLWPAVHQLMGACLGGASPASAPAGGIEGQAKGCCRKTSEASEGKMEYRSAEAGKGAFATLRYAGKTLSVTCHSPEAALSGSPDQVPDVILRPREKPLLTFVKSFLREAPAEELFLVSATLALLIIGGILERLDLRSWAWLPYALGFATGGIKGLQGAWEALREGTVDVDLLMILAALGAACIGAPFEGLMLLFLFSFSNVLQDFALERSRSAIRSISKLCPETVKVIRNGETETVPVGQVKRGERFRVRPGDRIPLDGILSEGETSVDQSTLTGESLPVNKSVGDPLFAGTFNQFGSVVVEATHTAEDSTLARLIRLVEEAQNTKAKTQTFLDCAEQRYAVGVIVLTLLLIVLPPLFGGVSWKDALYRALTVMVVASPCALVISTPASILSAIANAASKGVLFKGGISLEQAAEVTTLALDKTGTLTRGTPEVTSVVAFEGSREDILKTAAAVEARSEHPLAAAIVAFVRRQSLEFPESHSFEAFGGRGAQATVEGRKILLGSPQWIRNQMPESACHVLDEPVRQANASGWTSVAIAVADALQPRILGFISLADTLRDEAPAVLKQVREAGIRSIVMLTGDNRSAAESIGRACAVDEIHAGLLPAEKLDHIRSKGAVTPIAMVGDGTNDAPALSAAHVGIALGKAGSDIALESADVVLMSGNLERLPFVFRLSRAAKTVVIQNLAFSLTVIVLMVIATLILPQFGITVPLPAGVLAHEGGTVLVCLNGMRLLYLK